MFSLRNFTIFIWLFLYSSMLLSQDKEYYPNRISYRMGYGFITNHSPSMLYYTDRHISHQEITFEKANFLNSAWGREYPNSSYGIGLSYFDLETNILGKAWSVYPYLNFNILKREKVQIHFRTSIGLGYVSRPYDEISNYKNSAIGSRINLYFNFLGEFRWRFSEHYALSFAADFGHFSNTSFQKPNLGINIPTANLGLAYYFGEKQVKANPEANSFSPKKTQTELSLGLGMNEIYPANGEKYLAKAISLYRVKPLNFKSSIFYGLDLFHNPAITEELKRDSIRIDKNWETAQVGLSVGHYLHLGNFALGNTIGYYLKNENPYYTSLYFGISGNYRFNPKTSAFIQLKTHRAEAEYLLLGLRLKLHE